MNENLNNYIKNIKVEETAPNCNVDEILKCLFKNKQEITSDVISDIKSDISSSLTLDTGYLFDRRWLNDFDNFNDSMNDFIYIDSFKTAGDHLVCYSKSPFADEMLFSVMFCYMQFIELLLKFILSNYDKNYNNNKSYFTHNIISLWGKAKDFIEKDTSDVSLTTKHFILLDAIITSIFNTYNNSMSFRYKTDKKGKKSVSNDFKIDLSVLKIWMDIIETILYSKYGL